VVTLRQTIPALPVRDAAESVGFYRDRLRFQVLHHDGGFAVLGRDDAVLHLWQAGDESWRERDSLQRPVRGRMSRKRNDSPTTVPPGRVRGQSPDGSERAVS
jgi:catechol 2,3-dioxygenase-like lactoylglutathione lyase family enzyme